MTLIDFYYYNLGQEPTKEERLITTNTFMHLIDNGFSEQEIIKRINEFPVKMVLTPDDLPEVFWDGSLLKKNKFYYHHQLHILPPAPSWDVVTNTITSPKYYKEMKVKFTKEDIIAYFYKQFSTTDLFSDNKKDIGSIDYLLRKYEKLSNVNPVDFVMFLIDTAKAEDANLTDILQLNAYEKTNYDILISKVLNAEAKKLNKIIWR